MNQLPTPIPPKKLPDRAPSAPPRRPSGTSAPQKRASNVPMAMMVTLSVTAILLVISMVVLCVALAVGSPSSSGGHSDDDRRPAASNKDDPSDKPTDNPSGNKKPLYPTTPSRSSYQIPNGTGYRTISGISSGYAVLVELDSFSAVAGINADARICPASMTKIMTLLVACENLTSLTDTVTVSGESVTYQANHGASGLAWKGGEVVSVRDLLYAIYYRSDTVACLEMSKYIAGSEAAFVEMMNEKARSLGLRDTRFSNSTGLYFEGDEYYTTCREMAAIMAYALENRLASEIINSIGAYYFSAKDAPVSLIRPTWLTDRFASTAVLDTVTIKGAKTGYETIPGACLVSYAMGDSGKQYVQVIVGGNGLSAAKSTADVKHIYKNYAG